MGVDVVVVRGEVEVVDETVVVVVAGTVVLVAAVPGDEQAVTTRSGSTNHRIAATIRDPGG